MQTTHHASRITHHASRILVYVLMLASYQLLLSSCQKELDLKAPNENNSSTESQRLALSTKTNPYSRANIEKALTSLDRPINLDPDRLYYYYQFSPDRVTGDILALLEADTTSKILDFPFGNMAFYPSDGSGITQPQINSARDGKLYIVLKTNSGIAKLFEAGNSLDAIRLEELYLPENSDEVLKEQTLMEAKFYNDPQNLEQPGQNEVERRISFCKSRNPYGTVTYKDQHSGTDRRVPYMHVFGFAFGIMQGSHTNADGHYSIPYNFSAGTILYTHAKHPRVTVKPFNTTAGWASSLVSNFITGSTHEVGWHGVCAFKHPIPIHFEAHGQQRYWAQILSLVWHHDVYTWNNQIPSAAPNKLIIYAHWSATMGRASAPMLGHITTGIQGGFINNVFSFLFGSNFASQQPNLFNLMTGLLPDITYRQSETEQNEYSERLSQTMFHELAHASMFRRVGEQYWTRYIAHIVANGGYGANPTGSYWGLVQVGEAWAEYLGKVHHWKFHPNGATRCERQIFINPAPPPPALPYEFVDTYWTYPTALEEVPRFSEKWINTGVFYDITDNYRVEEQDDLIQGYSIKNMYDCFSPQTSSLCDWHTRFLQNHPSVSFNDMQRLMKNQNLWKEEGCK